MSFRNFVRSLALAASLAPLAACSPTIRKPRLLHPGPAPIQQYNATQFDPYPPNDLGPKIVGGRPLDYAVPLNEVTRARQFQPNGPQSAMPVLVPQTPAYVPTLPPTAPATGPPVEYRY
jgi:hypothetical protein